MELIEIEGKHYKIDMDDLMSWVSETQVTEKNINTITTLSYPITEEDMVEKEITENKSTLNDVFNNVRYDFVRSLINTLLTITVDGMGNVFGTRIEDFTFGQKLAFNTLLAKKIIIEETDYNYE